MAKPKTKEPLDGTTATTTFNDGKFIRTALVAFDETKGPLGGDQGSVDVVRIVKDAAGNAKVERICQINISHLTGKRETELPGEECTIVDVIDVDERYSERKMLAFSQTERKVEQAPKGGRLISAHFARKL